MQKKNFILQGRQNKSGFVFLRLSSEKEKDEGFKPD